MGEDLKITKAIVDSDMDGVLCGALLCSVFGDLQVTLTKPQEVQSGMYDGVVDENTVVADLAYIKGCGLYFDHHLSNKPNEDQKIIGLWSDLQCATKIIFEYYKNDFDLKKYKELVEFVDRFDRGLIYKSDIENPNSFIILAFNITREDKEFDLKVLKSLFKMNNTVDFFKEQFVIDRMNLFKQQLEEYYEYLKTHVEVVEKVAFVDNREFSHDMKHSYFVDLKYPNVDVVVMVKKQKNDPSILELTCFRNTFNDKRLDHNLLELAKAINPEFYGGHSYACGTTLPGSLSLEDAKLKIVKMLRK